MIRFPKRFCEHGVNLYFRCTECSKKMSKLGKKLIKAAKQGRAIAKRSAAAKDLGSPKYRKRVVESKKVYSRAKAWKARKVNFFCGACCQHRNATCGPDCIEEVRVRYGGA